MATCELLIEGCTYEERLGRYEKRGTEDKHLQYNTERENRVVGETEISVAETAVLSFSLSSALPPTLKLVKGTYVSRTVSAAWLHSKAAWNALLTPKQHVFALSHLPS